MTEDDAGPNNRSSRLHSRARNRLNGLYVTAGNTNPNNRRSSPHCRPRNHLDGYTTADNTSPKSSLRSRRPHSRHRSLPNGRCDGRQRRPDQQVGKGTRQTVRCHIVNKGRAIAVPTHPMQANCKVGGGWSIPISHCHPDNPSVLVLFSPKSLFIPSHSSPDQAYHLC